MFNPFEPFSLPLLEAFRSKNIRWLVGQTFKRADTKELQGKECIMLSHYHNYEMARVHLDAIKHDKYACIIDLEKEEHRRKVEDMLGALSKYSVWSSLSGNKEERNKQLSRRYKETMRRWIGSHTNWRIKTDSTFDVDYELLFGELFVVMRYGSQVERVKLETIEKL